MDVSDEVKNKILHLVSSLDSCFFYNLLQATALQYFKRFYLQWSVMQHHPKEIMYSSSESLKKRPQALPICFPIRNYVLKVFIKLSQVFCISDMLISQLISPW